MIPSKFILISDPRILSVPITEANEPLVNLEKFPNIKVRKSVAKKITQAEENLPMGIRFFIEEGLRPLSLQTHYFEEYSKKIRKLNPEWNNEKIRKEASKYIALIKDNGEQLDMGTALNDDTYSSENRIFTMTEAISIEAKSNRKILSDALSSTGFVNYPFEWWHWSYGDRYWAYFKKEEAIYGPATPN